MEELEKCWEAIYKKERNEIDRIRNVQAREIYGQREERTEEKVVFYDKTVVGNTMQLGGNTDIAAICQERGVRYHKIPNNLTEHYDTTKIVLIDEEITKMRPVKFKEQEVKEYLKKIEKEQTTGAR